MTWSNDLNMWERHLNLNDQDIPLMVWTQDDHKYGAQDQIFLTVRISDKVQGFEKIGSMSLHPGANMDNEPGGNPMNISDQFFSDLTGLSNKIPCDWFDGKTISFTTPERSDPWIWKLGPQTKVIVDTLDKPIGGGFFKEKGLGVYDGIDGPEQTTYQVRVFYG